MAFDASNQKLKPIYAQRALEIADRIEKSPTYWQGAFSFRSVEAISILARMASPERLATIAAAVKAAPKNCQTPACVAGHAVFEMVGRDTDAYNRISLLDMQRMAAEYLGLKGRQIGAMFAAWPASLDVQPNGKQAAAMLRRYATTGSVSWRGLKRLADKV